MSASDPWEGHGLLSLLLLTKPVVLPFQVLTQLWCPSRWPGPGTLWML